MYRIYVNDAEIDLDPSTVIAVTFQAADIGNGDLVTRKASFTNQISVPKTANNRTVFGVSDDIHSASDFPYIINGMRVISNGIQIMSGTIVLQNTAERFNLRLYSVIKDLTVALGNKMLDELDFGDTPITWDAAYWDSKRASTSGFCAPVFNYGQIDSTLANGTIGTVYLPSVAYKDILTQIITEAGYTITSNDFYASDEFFNNMAMSYGRHGEFPTTTIKINQILPGHISQVDFVRDFAAHFGGYFKFDGTAVEILLLKDIITNLAGAVDYTNKRANKKFDLSYSWDGWARKNIFSFPSALRDKNPFDFGSEFYEGSIACENVNVEQSRPVYTSIFQRQTSVRSEYDGVSYQIASAPAVIRCANLPVWNDAVPTTYTFDNEPEPMLYILRDAEHTAGVPEVEGTIRYNGIDRADYKVAYFGGRFTSPASTITFGKSMHWNGKDTGAVQEVGFLEQYYAPLESILENPKKVEREYTLNDIDIYGLELLTPIYDEGDYFLINSVGQYVPGRLTKLELLRLATSV